MDTRILGYAGVGMFLGLILFVRGFKTMKRKKLMESLPTSKIRSLAVGVSEIHGKVLPSKSGIIKSPFSNQDCVCSRITIEESSRFSKYRHWHVVKNLVWGHNFFLEDETGQVLVDLQDAELDIPVSFEFYSGLGTSPTPRVVEFLKKNNMNHEGFLGINRSLRYTELIIRPRDELYVLGRVDVNPSVDGDNAEHGIENLVMQKSHNPNIYYISNRSEKQILGKINFKIIGQVVGGPLLLGGCLLFIALNLLNFR